MPGDLPFPPSPPSFNVFWFSPTVILLSSPNIILQWAKVNNFQDFFFNKKTIIYKPLVIILSLLINMLQNAVVNVTTIRLRMFAGIIYSGWTISLAKFNKTAATDYTVIISKKISTTSILTNTAVSNSRRLHNLTDNCKDIVVSRFITVTCGSV